MRENVSLITLYKKFKRPSFMMAFFLGKKLCQKDTVENHSKTQV